MKNKAFTLAEILIALTIIGLIAVIMVKNIQSDEFKKKANVAKVNKVINTFDEAMSNLRDVDSTYCPLGKFIIKNGGTYETAYVIPSGKTVIDMFSEFIKFEKTGIKFCSYTGYCSDTTTPGAKMSGDIYIGIEVLSSISDCPNFYMPDSESTSSQVTVRNRLKENAKPKCWAKLKIDTNGNEAPNQEGEDVYVFGLDEDGVHH